MEFLVFFRFYDGICSWEEGSQTPVIGAVMSKHFISLVNSFHPEIRESFRECEDFQPTPPHSPNTAAAAGVDDKLKLPLYSAKMTDLKQALTSKEKMNVSSTSLLLTALSQTHVKKRVKKGEYDVTYSNNRRKRKRM